MRIVKWEQRVLRAANLAGFLTAHNFQPGEFVVIPMPDNPQFIIVVAVTESTDSE